MMTEEHVISALPFVAVISRPNQLFHKFQKHGRMRLSLDYTRACLPAGGGHWAPSWKLATT